MTRAVALRGSEAKDETTWKHQRVNTAANRWPRIGMIGRRWAGNRLFWPGLPAVVASVLLWTPGTCWTLQVRAGPLAVSHGDEAGDPNEIQDQNHNRIQPQTKKLTLWTEDESPEIDHGE